MQKLQIPTIIFINKIDRAGVNLERLDLDIKTNLSQDVLFMQTVVDGVVYPICTSTILTRVAENLSRETEETHT